MIFIIYRVVGTSKPTEIGTVKMSSEKSGGVALNNDVKWTLISGLVGWHGRVKKWVPHTEQECGYCLVPYRASRSGFTMIGIYFGRGM